MPFSRVSASALQATRPNANPLTKPNHDAALPRAFTSRGRAAFPAAFKWYARVSQKSLHHPWQHASVLLLLFWLWLFLRLSAAKITTTRTTSERRRREVWAKKRRLKNSDPFSRASQTW